MSDSQTYAAKNQFTTHKNYKLIPHRKNLLSEDLGQLLNSKNYEGKCPTGIMSLTTTIYNLH